MSKPENSHKRSKNFDNLEREVLLEAALENKEIIEKNNKVWKEVQMKVNALGVASRSVPEVKNKWNNMIQNRLVLSL